MPRALTPEQITERAHLRVQISNATGLPATHRTVLRLANQELRARRGGIRRSTLEEEIRQVVDGSDRGRSSRASSQRGKDLDPLEVVLREIRNVDGRGRYGDRKVFISALWDRVKDELGMSLLEFKRWLFQQHRAGVLELVRGDLSWAFPDDLRVASTYATEEPYVGATFHFVLDPYA